MGCDAGTALPLLWCVELIPDGENNSYRPPHPMYALGTSQIFWPELEAFPELGGMMKGVVCGRYAAGEFDLGCIGISTALHLAAPMVRSHPGSLPLDALVHLTRSYSC